MAIGNVDGHGDTPHKTNETTEPDADFLRIDLHVTLTESPKVLPAPENLQFGTIFTDHMAIATFEPSTGWSDPEIKPYAPFTIDPASSCLQYSTNIFEGMKAYLGPDGKARLFRPELNMRRLERSAARLALPPFDGDDVLELIKRFVEIEKRWIPSLQGYSLYLRPTIFGTRLCTRQHLMLPQYASSRRPVDHTSRGVYDRYRSSRSATKSERGLGELGADKRVAAKQGYDQVLWLFGDDKRVTEAGAMNFFVVVKRDDGNVFPGVTRASCLALASDPVFKEAASLNLHPIERTFTMDDLVQWSSQGKLAEALCVGTAAIVAAVNKIGYEGKDIKVPEYEVGLGPVGMAFREKILAIQEGRDEYEGWSVVCE
ncbi:aminotransferase [Melanogaster broomeanus]|nr:aminotransferase [Melanogaster broomeanus]